MKIKHLGRKLISLVLSAALVIPLSLPALAALGDGNADADDADKTLGGYDDKIAAQYHFRRQRQHKIARP